MPVATRSFIEAGSSLARESIALPKDRVAAVALPLKTVYDLDESDSVYDLAVAVMGSNPTVTFHDVLTRLPSNLSYMGFATN